MTLTECDIHSINGVMMANNIEHEPDTNDNRKPQLTWTVVVFTRLKAKAYAIVAFFAATAIACYFMFGHSLMWSGISVAILLVAFGSVFTPHTYSLCEETVEVKTWFGVSLRRWSEFHRAVAFPLGINLVTRVSESRFEHFRSVNLYLPEESGEIRAFIERKIAENAEQLEREVSESK